MINFLGAMSPATLVVVIAAGIVAAIALVLAGIKWYIDCVKTYSNYKKVNLDVTAEQLARANLDKAGLTDVEVVVARLRNSYNHRTKKLYISRRMNRKTTVFSVSRVMQLVALAALYATDENLYKRRHLSELLNGGASLVFFASIIIDLVIGISTHWEIGIWAVVLFIVALGFYIFTTIYSIRCASIIKKSNETAMKMVQNLGIFEPEDEKRIARLYKMSVLEYNIDVVLSVVYIVYYGIKIVAEIFKLTTNK